MLIPYDGLSVMTIVSVHWILDILKSPPIIISGKVSLFISVSLFLSRETRPSSL